MFTGHTGNILAMLGLLAYMKKLKIRYRREDHHVEFMVAPGARVMVVALPLLNWSPWGTVQYLIGFRPRTRHWYRTAATLAAVRDLATYTCDNRMARKDYWR